MSWQRLASVSRCGHHPHRLATRNEGLWGVTMLQRREHSWPQRPRLLTARLTISTHQE